MRLALSLADSQPLNLVTKTIALMVVGTANHPALQKLAVRLAAGPLALSCDGLFHYCNLVSTLLQNEDFLVMY